MSLNKFLHDAVQLDNRSVPRVTSGPLSDDLVLKAGDVMIGVLEVVIRTTPDVLPEPRKLVPDYVKLPLFPSEGRFVHDSAEVNVSVELISFKEVILDLINLVSEVVELGTVPPSMRVSIHKMVFGVV